MLHIIYKTQENLDTWPAELASAYAYCYNEQGVRHSFQIIRNHHPQVPFNRLSIEALIYKHPQNSKLFSIINKEANEITVEYRDGTEEVLTEEQYGGEQFEYWGWNAVQDEEHRLLFISDDTGLVSNWRYD
jgi:hypothetical protein